MSEFIDITSRQDFAPPKVQMPLPTATATAPDTERLKKHFSAIFSSHTHVNAFVVRSNKGHYQLRMDKSGLLYTEKSEGYTEEIHYAFKENHVLHNNQPQPLLFLKKFMARLREISGDIEDNLATVYEEVL